MVPYLNVTIVSDAPNSPRNAGGNYSGLEKSAGIGYELGPTPDQKGRCIVDGGSHVPDLAAS